MLWLITVQVDPMTRSRSSRDQAKPPGPTATTVGILAPVTNTPPYTPCPNGGAPPRTQGFPPSLGDAVAAELSVPRTMPFCRSRKATELMATSGIVSTLQLRP